MNNSAHKEMIIKYLIESKTPVSNIEFLPAVMGGRFEFEQGKMVVTVHAGTMKNKTTIKIKIGTWFEVLSFEVESSGNIPSAHLSRALALVSELNKMRREFFGTNEIPSDPF